MSWRIFQNRTALQSITLFNFAEISKIFSIAWAWIRGFIFDSLWHFITKCDRYYYKMWQLFYYKTRKNFTTKCDRFFIIKRDNFIKKIRQFITNCDDFITKCDIYYKIQRLLEMAKVHEAITQCQLCFVRDLLFSR